MSIPTSTIPEPDVAEIEENAISEEERLAREALLTEKMAKMREKNEAIRKRYDEVQEDLKNAQAISSQVKVESESDDESKKPIRKVVNKTPPRDRESKKFTPRRQNSESNEQQSPEQVPLAAAARPIHAFGEGEGPPPDPGYNFLADEERDGPKQNKEQVNISGQAKSPDHEHLNFQKEKAQTKNNTTFSGPGGSFKQRGARNPRQRGGHRGGRQFSNEEFGRENQSGGTQDKDQKWREERQQIDEARVKRGTNSEGNWRREWDNEKSDSQQQPQHQQSSYRGGRGRGESGGGSGGYRGQNPRGNGTKFFYQRGRGNYHSQGDNNSQNDRWEREAPQNIQGPQGGAPSRDLRDIINSKRSSNGSGRFPSGGPSGSRFEQQPRRDPKFSGSNRHHAADNDDEWEDVE